MTIAIAIRAAVRSIARRDRAGLSFRHECRLDPLADRRELLFLRLARREVDLFQLADEFLAALGSPAELVDQRRGDALQRAVGLALQVPESDVVNLADAVRERAVPVELVDHRPPDQAENR